MRPPAAPGLGDPPPRLTLHNAPRLSRGRYLLLSVALALALWLPRGIALDHFVAVDERSWLTRAGNFYLALSTGDWAATFQRYHPGVTTMWLGMLGYWAAYPDYPADAAGQITSMSDGVEDFLAGQGHPPIRVMAAARAVVVTVTVGLLVVAFWLAAGLIGRTAALIGILLLGYEPMGLGLTRMLHVDGLSSTFMLVAALAYLRYRVPAVQGGARLRHLLTAGVCTGLAALTKSPALFLGPLIVLLAALEWLLAWRRTRTWPPAPLWPTVRALAIWGGVAAFTFVALWPAMWVDPVGSLAAIVSAAGESAEEGHSKEIFFNGAILSGDPGPIFYPLTYLWHTTPVTLVGLALAGIAGAVTWRRRGLRWATAARLLLFALLFTAFMTLGSKKFDRYLLPAYFPLALVAGVGWTALTRWEVRHGLRRLLPLTLVVAIGGQMAAALPHFPYYFTYYNPLLGGITRAHDVLMIGLGEGMDEAARALNAQPDADQLTAAAWYRGGSFNYFFVGQDVDLEAFFLADYAVLYVHQWQRQVPSRGLLDYFATLTPVHTVRLHGLDYAWVYDLRAAPPPTAWTDWANALRLVETQLPRAPLAPGDEFVARLRLYTIGTVATNLNAVVRLVDVAGQEVARSQGWPFGSPTSTWQPGEVYVDGHTFTLPPETPAGYLRVELGFYDAEAQTLLTPTVAGTTTPRGEFVGVGYVAVGTVTEAAVAPSALADASPVLGDQVRLQAASLDGAAWDGRAPLRVTAPAAHLPLRLTWEALRPARADYVTLLHLLGPDGALAAQWDRAPLLGVVPTTLWREDDTLHDTYTLTLPPDLPAGEYRLLVGLYDLPTLTRLPVVRDGAPQGDTVHVATLIIP